MSELSKKMNRLKKDLQDENFLRGKGLSNEVNIRIFTYDPADEMKVRYFISQLKSMKNLKCNLKECNLYEIFLKICENKKLPEKILKMEEKKGSDFLLSKILKFSTPKEFVNVFDYKDHKEGDVILVTGVGEGFPFMRVSALLEEFQINFDDVPVVVMYPGKYNGRELQLFEEFKPNEYYRAFNVIEEEEGDI